MKDFKKELKEISVIIPNCDFSNLSEIERTVSKTIPSGFSAVYILVHKQKTKKLNDDSHIFVECEKDYSYNEQITKAFESVRGECVIICDTNVARYPEYLAELIKQWRLGAKIVRTKVQPSTTFWAKIGNFFVKIKNALYNLFLKLNGYKPDALCLNTFQLFDKQVYNLIKALPEKNAYLRNSTELKSYDSIVLTTNEKIKVKSDKLDWDAKLITSVTMLGLFGVFFVLSFVLYPFAKQRKFNYTFVSLMVFICVGLVLGSIAFFYWALIEKKMGYKHRVKAYLADDEDAQDEEKAETAFEEKLLIDEDDKNLVVQPEVQEQENKPKSNKSQAKDSSKKLNALGEQIIDEPEEQKVVTESPVVIDGSVNQEDLPQRDEAQALDIKAENTNDTDSKEYVKRTRKHNKGAKKMKISEVAEDNKKIIKVIK